MKTLRIKNVEIGKGIPKICVPLVGKTRAELCEEVANVNSVPCDVVDWRADFFGETVEIDGIVAMLDEIKEPLRAKPLLFTFRSGNEGGAKEISIEDYLRLNEKVILSGNADIVDVELFSGEDTVKKLVYLANKNGVCVLVSNHDFSMTPAKETMIKRLCKMQELGADITKIAVMPETLKDVLAVLDVMAEMVECYADKPFVAISMSGTGFVSRIIGETFGSCMTYGSLRQTSAPGQAAACDLDKLLRLLHKSY